MSFNTFRKGILPLFISVLVLSSSGFVNAAGQGAGQNDGATGETSEGHTHMKVTVPQLYRITGMADIDFGQWDGSAAALERSLNACVRSNGNETYTVRFATQETDNTFKLVGTATKIDYLVSWGGTNVLTGDAPTGTRHSSNMGTNPGDCANNTDQLKVSIPFLNLEAAAVDSYTGTLTLTISAT